MKVKELIEHLSGYDPNMDVIVCDLNDDGDGEGNMYLPPVDSIDVGVAITNGQYKDCVFINIRH